jgi:GDP-mannose 6-dehydrogenase
MPGQETSGSAATGGAERRRIAVFGLGYVGSVSAACLSDVGHSVVGVDPIDSKVAALSAGTATVGEPLLGDLVRAAVAQGRLAATTDVPDAVARTDLALICVGTPSGAAGGVSFDALVRVSEEIGTALRTRSGSPYTVVVRSTVPPGTARQVVIPALESSSGLVAGRDFGVAVNPEFLREGSAVEDFRSPPKTVVGSDDTATAGLVASLYEGLPGPVFCTPVEVAEAIKYADNAFHALKVSFANEVGELCAALDIDSHAVFDIVRADTKLNASGAYLRPGFAFGGSCLPKDLRGILHTARHADVAMPVLEHVLESNERQIERASRAVLDSGAARVALFGLAFKAGTDDLRESPLVALGERLLGRGISLRIHDAAVDQSRLHGTNLAFIEERIPHLSGLLSGDMAEIAAWADACVIGTSTPELAAVLAQRDNYKLVLDLHRGAHSEHLRSIPTYRGASW